MKTNTKRLLSVFATAAAFHAFAFAGTREPDKISFDSVTTTEPCIAITFDDGPSSMLTPQVLKILADRNVKATFFVTGENAASHPDILKQEFAAGHEIGSRSWAHSLFSHVTDDELLSDLQRTDQAIKTAIGSSPHLFSPFDLSFTSVQCDTVNKQFGYTVIYWNVDSLAVKSRGAAAIADAIISQAKPGSIIMSSDIDASSIQALPYVIDTLCRQGLQIRHRPRAHRDERHHGQKSAHTARRITHAAGGCFHNEPGLIHTFNDHPCGHSHRFPSLRRCASGQRNGGHRSQRQRPAIRLQPVSGYFTPPTLLLLRSRPSFRVPARPCPPANPRRDCAPPACKSPAPRRV